MAETKERRMSEVIIADPPTLDRACSVAPYATIPEVRDAQDRVVRPFAVILGGMILGQLDTPEKIARLHRPDVIVLRHADLKSEQPLDKLELQQVTQMADGTPVYGFRVIEEDGIKDALARVLCDIVVGYSPEVIADDIRNRVLDAFRLIPPYIDGHPLDQPAPVDG
jgi:hypothetical protein